MQIGMMVYGRLRISKIREMGRQRGQGIIKNLDGLTQIANRRRFDKYLSQEWRPIAREQQYLSLILNLM